VALGNALRSGVYSEATVAALNSRADHPSEVVREHVQWALSQQL
jgi:epoxyqueuosine reductase